jgi:hypothetical protein
MTAIHPDYQTPTTPLYLFTSPDVYGRGHSRIALPSHNANPPPFLWLHHTLASDDRFSPAALGLKRPDEKANVTSTGMLYRKVLTGAGPLVMQLVNEWYDRWTVAVPEEELENRLQKMVEDVVVGNAFWYAISGFAARGSNTFNADFVA